MLINPKGKYGKYLILGIQTNKGNTHNQAKWQANEWSPKRAKSFSFTLTNTDYHGKSVEEETGYATMKVEYFTTIKEGDYPKKPSYKINSDEYFA